MMDEPFGRQARIPVLSRRVEIGLGAGAIGAIAMGAFWLFGGGPAPIETVQQMAMLAPPPLADSSPMPKLDHDDPANPTIAFMTAVSLAHVASLKLPALAAAPIPAGKTHVTAMKAHTTKGRQNIVPALFKPLPPRRPADLDSAALTQPKTAIVPAVQIAAPAPKHGLPLLDNLTGLVPTPEKLGRGIVWVGDSVGSLARRL